jgi:two-component system sensor histidine kinase QseC
MSEHPASSIRRHLLALLLASVAVIWIAMGVASYIEVRHEIDELLDAHLAQAASLLIAQAGHDIEEIEEHAPDVHRYARRVAFQLWEGGTRLRLHSSNAPLVRLSTKDEGFSDARIDGQRWRVFSGWDRHRRYVVQVGERAGGRNEIVKAMARNLLLPLVVALPLLAVFVWLAIERVLRPLSILNREVAHRAPDRLAPLDVGRAPAEVAPLVQNLNALFDRVHASIERERRFTSDAAHELRTPLAALRAQAQVARGATGERERTRALDNVIAGCDRAAHLVDQLLTLARLEPGMQKHAQEVVSLAAVAQNAIAAIASFAVSRDIEMELHDEATPRVHGDPRLLAILLRNLLDNAIRYGPSGSVVRVDVGRRGDRVFVTISDRGPGVEATARERLGRRFERLGVADVPGTGLGLSIVKRIAELHEAQLAFAEAQGGGLAVTVTFCAA